MCMEEGSSPQYIHIAPDGDHWLSDDKVYAAKHVPEDFVVSLPLPADFDVTSLTEAELHAAYDSKSLPLKP